MEQGNPVVPRIVRGSTRRARAHGSDSHDGFGYGLALIPVALGMGKAGSEIQAPMAIVIVFGLFSSTTLNMIVVPAALVRFGGTRTRGV